MEIVSVADLKIGMFVVEPDCPWSEFSFALQGFVITSPEQVDIFQQKCRFVSIDRSRSLNEHYAAPKPEWDKPFKASSFRSVGAERGGGLELSSPLVPSVQEKQRARRRRFFDFLRSQKDDEHILALSRELTYIEPRYDELSDALQNAFDGFAEGREVDIPAVREGLRDIAGSLRRNSDAVMWLLRLRQRDQYSFDHAMDVSVNMIMLGTHIGWREHQLLELGLAGMMQDVGKTQLPVALLTKTTALSATERKLVQSHVASSLEILHSQADIPPEVIMTVTRHHERWDGSGYPLGLKFEEIGMAAEIAGMADSFCAMLKDKPYRNALGHQQALEELHNLRGKQFNPALMEQFVQCVGLYPIGTLVELNTGEVAVVIQQNRVQRSKPRLVVMLDADKVAVRSYRIIDLREAANARLRIAKALPHNAYGLAPNDYYLG